MKPVSFIPDIHFRLCDDVLCVCIRLQMEVVES